MPRRLLFLVLLAAAAAGAEVTQRTANNGNVVLDGIPEIPERLAGELNRYLNVRSASFRSWTEDGSGMFVTTRFGEVSQLHRVDTPGGARYQLTFFPEPVRGADRRPGTEELVLSMDEGGGEFFQLFLFDPTSGESRRLTDGESRNGGAQWSRDGGRLAYTSTRRNGTSKDLWILDPANPDEARMTFEAPDTAYWLASDWSADGTRQLLAQYVSANESRVHLLDLASGESRLLAGGEDEPGNHTGVDPVFDASGEGYFSASDADGEFRRLVHTRIDTGERRPVTDEIPWDVRQLALSDDRARGAFVVNQDGIDRLYLLDPASLEYRAVEGLPTGLIGGLTFSPDGSRLAMNLNTPQTPSDVYSLELGGEALAAGALTRWTWSEVGGLDTDRFAVPELVHFPTFDEVGGEPRRIPAFVYLPPGEGPHPVILTIHGGPEAQYRPAFRAQVQTWVDLLGAAVVAPNVRGSSGYGKSYLKLDNGLLREDSVRDIGALLDWIATRDDLDADRVVVYGGSYGGYMVLASLVHYSDRLRAGVDIVGISNFVSFLENTQGYRRDLRRVEYGDERDPEMRAHLERISPNRSAAKITSPLFVAQGQNDPRVPVSESEQIVRDMRAAGHDVWYMNALNEGHGFRKKENRDLFAQVVMLFLEEHLLASERADG